MKTFPSKIHCLHLQYILYTISFSLTFKSAIRILCLIFYRISVQKNPSSYIYKKKLQLTLPETWVIKYA